MRTTSEELKGGSAATQPVGYCNPPEATRFKKGVSGNPRGRPKGSLNVTTVLTRTLREKVVINEHGQRKTITKLEAAIKQLVNKAASGDLRALQQLVGLARDAEAKQNVAETHDPVLNDLDQAVIEGILKRFPAGEDDGHKPEEVYDGEDQRG